MKSKIIPENKPFLTRGSVIDDLGFAPAEALEIRVKAEVYRELLSYIHDRGLRQQDLAAVLGIYQSDVSNLMSGRVSKFSVSKLLRFAGKLNLGANIRLTKPRLSAKTAAVPQETVKKRRSAVV